MRWPCKPRFCSALLVSAAFALVCLRTHAQQALTDGDCVDVTSAAEILATLVEQSGQAHVCIGEQQRDSGEGSGCASITQLSRSDACPSSTRWPLFHAYVSLERFPRCCRRRCGMPATTCCTPYKRPCRGGRYVRYRTSDNLV